MHILQHPFRVVRRGQAQIFLHFLIPKRWEVFDLDVSGNQRGFKFETQENMQVVRHFVRFDANKIGAHDVNRTVKIFKRDVAQLLWKIGLKARQKICPERPAAANHIFPEARLRFMHRH